MAMKTGVAYGFLDYKCDQLDYPGKSIELLRELGLQRGRANFSEFLEFAILDDKESESFGYDHERSSLPRQIAELARTTDVYESFLADRFPDSPRTAKKAIDLRYLVRIEIPEASDTRFSRPLGQGMANQVAARRLYQIFGQFINVEPHKGRSGALRSKVFYQDGRGRAQRI